MGIRIIIMCKAPVEGRVKTRLATVYGQKGATRLHVAMATTVIERASTLFDDVVIAADDPSHPFFQTFGLNITKQGEGDLGERMQRQVRDAFTEGVDAVMLLGTDSPHMSEQRLLHAVSLLQQHDVVIGPVEDGGYELLLASAAFPLFEQVNWSSALVLKQTVAHIEKLALTYNTMDEGFDVDYPDQVKRSVLAGWQAGAEILPL